MCARLIKGVMVFISLIAVLALCVPALAASPSLPGSSESSAGAPLSGWVSIQPGETQWYKFRYHYDNSKDDNTPSQALVLLKASDESRAVNFAVQTAATLALPKEDKDGHLNGPLGVGSPMERSYHEHNATAKEMARDKKLMDEHRMIQNWTQYVWSGSARANETFYVLVHNSGNAPELYELSISGPDVAF